ncbi:MAG: hypothetical protein GVY14_06745 [Spirochaetes bacterium]|jgi:tetratricopeptide (TPR) repeat protein|nr:hypothetical protein [Spirochaetota bacterium]
MSLRAGIITGLCLLLLSGVYPGATADATETDRALSRLYAEYSLSALVDDRGEEAVSFAETSLEFDADNSDAHHILARSRAGTQVATTRVVEHLEQALRTGSFRITDEGEARLLLAETYVRIGAAGDALDVLDADAPGAPEPELSYLTARALLALGEVEAAEQVALRGRRLYPEDPRFVLFLLRRDPVPGPRTGRWLDANVSEDPAYLESLLYYAERVGAPERAVTLSDRYLALGGENPRVALVRADAGGRIGGNAARSREAAWELFVRMDGLRDKGAVEEMYALLPDGELKSRVRDVLSDYNGTVERDEDRNGFWEERFIFSDGGLERWQVDRNQDGVLEYDMLVASRVPRSLEATPEGYVITYGAYPEVSTVEAVDGELMRRYQVLPGRLTYRVLADDVDWGSPVPGPALPFSIAEVPPVLDDELLRDNAFRLELGTPEGPITRVLTLEDGIFLREAIDEDGDGRIDHVISYEEGNRVAGMRDADHDGRFEVAEQYDDGELALLLVDADGDNTFEYRERLQPEASVSWDYDGDGVVDARELMVGRSEIVRQFSTDGDEDFELSMTIYREAVPNE